MHLCVSNLELNAKVMRLMQWCIPKFLTSGMNHQNIFILGSPKHFKQRLLSAF